MNPRKRIGYRWFGGFDNQVQCSLTGKELEMKKSDYLSTNRKMNSKAQLLSVQVAAEHRWVRLELFSTSSPVAVGNRLRK